MPHLTMEYSANLEGEVDLDGLCSAVHAAMLETRLFEIGAIRVRAIAARHVAIADRDPRNAFVDLSLRVGTGRSLDDRRRAGDAIMKAAEAFLADRLAQPHFALSLEVREVDPQLSWKKNAMHARLRG